MILEEIVSQTLSRCGNPPQEILHAEEVTNTVLAVLARKMQELSASDRDLLATVIPFIPATREGVFAGASSPPSFVQQVYDTTSDSRTPIAVVDISDLDEDGQNGRRSVAFYRLGSELHYRFSWDTSSESYEYMFWFNAEAIQVAALTDSPPVPENFGDMFADLATLEVLPQIILRDILRDERGQPIVDRKGAPVAGPYARMMSAQAALINNRMSEWRNLWESFVFDSAQDSSGQKDSFNESRTRVGEGGRWLSTRF